MKSGIEDRARFDFIRYSQVWEDADLLVEALNVGEGDAVLSIASAGDNAFALLAQGPWKVYAVDLSFAQIACCELRKAMYRQLTHKEHLAFGGVQGASGGVQGASGAAQNTNNDGPDNMDRLAMFESLELPSDVRAFWSDNATLIKDGFMAQGKFERYFALFRKKVLPLVHSRREVEALIAPKSAAERCDFYDKVWDNRRWRLMFRLFFSRFLMGRLGRDKEFFKYVEGSVADRILSRAKHALTVLDASDNPYLHYILNGEYSSAHPYALREENYEAIRRNLDNIEFHTESVESFIQRCNDKIDAANLSDIFEYMTQDAADAIYGELLKKAAPGARIAYWNMLAPRSCGEALRVKYGVSTSEEDNARHLAGDKAFFYSKFYLDRVES